MVKTTIEIIRSCWFPSFIFFVLIYLQLSTSVNFTDIRKLIAAQSTNYNIVNKDRDQLPQSIIKLHVSDAVKKNKTFRNFEKRKEHLNFICKRLRQIINLNLGSKLLVEVF